MAKETRSVISKRAGATERGASEAYRSVRSGTGDEWHVKTPSALMYTSALCTEGFPQEAPLTLRQLEDQERLVKKSLVADALWAAFLGKENVAQTGHWKGSFDGKQEQHYMASRIATDVETLDRCTDTSHKKRLYERDPLTRYHGKDIVNGEVEGKPITGFGASAGIAILTRAPDLHPGNFAFHEDGDKIQVFKFDNKFDLGAERHFLRKFMVDQLQEEVDIARSVLDKRNDVYQFLEKHSDTAEPVFLEEQARYVEIRDRGRTEFLERSQTLCGLDKDAVGYVADLDFDGLKGSYEYLIAQDQEALAVGEEVDGAVLEKRRAVLEFLESDPRAETIFLHEQAEFNGIDNREASREAADYARGSRTLHHLDPDDIEEKGFDEVKEAYGEYLDEAIADHQLAEGKHKAGLVPLLPALDTPGSLDAMLRDIFPGRSAYENALSSDQNVFKFPFADDFAQAPHVKREFLDTMYLIANADRNRVGDLVISVMGDTERSRKVAGQLAANMDELRAGMERCPEYRGHVAVNKGRLDATLEKVHQTLEEKKTEVEAPELVNVKALESKTLKAVAHEEIEGKPSNRREKFLKNIRKGERRLTGSPLRQRSDDSVSPHGSDSEATLSDSDGAGTPRSSDEEISPTLRGKDSPSLYKQVLSQGMELEKHGVKEGVGSSKGKEEAFAEKVRGEKEEKQETKAEKDKPGSYVARVEKAKEGQGKSNDR